MRGFIALLLAGFLVLAGCGSPSTTSSSEPPSTTATPAPPVPSTLPEIDGPYTGDYFASVDLSPEIPPTGPGIILQPDAGVTILEGWFVPEDGDPILASVDNNHPTTPILRNSTTVDHLHDFFKQFSSEDFSSIDIVLTIEESGGAIRTVSIDDARFEHLE